MWCLDLVGVQASPAGKAGGYRLKRPGGIADRDKMNRNPGRRTTPGNRQKGGVPPAQQQHRMSMALSIGCRSEMRLGHSHEISSIARNVLDLEYDIGAPAGKARRIQRAGAEPSPTRAKSERPGESAGPRSRTLPRSANPALVFFVPCHQTMRRMRSGFSRLQISAWSRIVRTVLWGCFSRERPRSEASSGNRGRRPVSPGRGPPNSRNSGRRGASAGHRR